MGHGLASKQEGSRTLRDQDFKNWHEESDMSLWRWKEGRDKSRREIIASSVLTLLIIVFIVVRTALYFWYSSQHPKLIPH
jgi:hypothetical protein